jgi:hypothetical protein
MVRKAVTALTIITALALPAAAWALPSHLLYSFNMTVGGSPGPALTLHNGASTTGYGLAYSVEDPANRALTLDGVDDYAEREDSTFQPASDGDFSVSVWAKSNNWGYSWQPLIFQDDDDHDTYSWAIYGTTNDSGTVHAYVRIRDGATLQTLNLGGSPSTLYDGAWHHVALSVDGNEAELYFDGTLVDDQASTLTNGTVNVDADHLFVGGDLYYESEKFGGFIDSLRYFDSAIDGDDLAEIYPSS